MEAGVCRCVRLPTDGGQDKQDASASLSWKLTEGWTRYHGFSSHIPPPPRWCLCPQHQHAPQTHGRAPRHAPRDQGHRRPEGCGRSASQAVSESGKPSDVTGHPQPPRASSSSSSLSYSNQWRHGNVSYVTGWAKVRRLLHAYSVNDSYLSWRIYHQGNLLKTFSQNQSKLSCIQACKIIIFKD